MKNMSGVVLLVLVATAGSALAQSSTVKNPYMPQRPNSVKPNSQNLMQGPSSWTPQQRRLNVPGADANPSLRRQTLPYTGQPPVTQQAPPSTPATPVPAETPPKPPIL